MMLDKLIIKNKKGFTLIELLIVVAIIGILAAIAIPQFASYRQRAFNSAAQSDLRTVRTGVEAHFAESYVYPTEATPGWTTAGTDDEIDVGGAFEVPLSARVEAWYAGDDISYVIAARNTQGTRTFGTSQEKTALFWFDGLAQNPPALASDVDWVGATWNRL